MKQSQRIAARSAKLIAQGKAGDGIKLAMLSREVRTMREGDEVRRA